MRRASVRTDVHHTLALEEVGSVMATYGRRLVPLFVLCVLTTSLGAEAQPAANKVPHIGVLWGGNAAFAEAYVEAGRRALAELGLCRGEELRR
jgi:hypothetical protein